MKRTLFQGLVLALFILTAVPAAADITHNFQSKYSAGTLVTVDATHTSSTNDGIVYALSGAYFGAGTGTYNVCLNLFTSGDYAIVSPALHTLHSITINYLPSEKLSNIVVQLSTDGSNWTSVTPTTVYNTGNLVVTAPTDGDYFVKIRRSGGKNVSITQISYNFGDCNCFTYTPE